MIDHTLQQIALLLSVGLGEAGTVLIGGKLSAGGKLDMASAGKRVTGAFGFCDIRHFADTTECLQVRRCGV